MSDLRDRILTACENIPSRIAGAMCGISHTSILNDRKVIKEKDLNKEKILVMSDDELKEIFKGRRIKTSDKIEPNPEHCHNDMQAKGMTVKRSHKEYVQDNPGKAVSYSTYNRRYRRYLKKLARTLRISHPAGEITFVDFAGMTVPYQDQETGEVYQAQIFVAVLGCSRLIFAFAVKSQKLADWIKAHIALFYFLGGVTKTIICDNLKAAVTWSGRKLRINKTYKQLGNHYGFFILPARVYRPKDKAPVEVGVKIVEQEILVALRHCTFFSIEEINGAISGLLKELNERPLQKLPGSRWSRFVQFDQPLLQHLPADSFVYGEWQKAQKIGPDYHLYVNGHGYSVPNERVGDKMEAFVTDDRVDIHCDNEFVTSHKRSDEREGHTTKPEHQLKEHRAFHFLSQENLLTWAEEVGEYTLKFVQHQFENKTHANAMKACVGLQNSAKENDRSRIEAACERVDILGSYELERVRNFLYNNRELMDLDLAPVQGSLPLHVNVRGADYFSGREV